MKAFVLAGVFVAASLGISAPAVASDAALQVELCAAALDSEGVAAAADYRAKFLKTKGGATKTITLQLVPNAEGAAAIVAECQIRRGEVIDVAVKS